MPSLPVTQKNKQIFLAHLIKIELKTTIHRELAQFIK